MRGIRGKKKSGLAPLRRESNSERPRHVCAGEGVWGGSVTGVIRVSAQEGG